MLRWAFRVAILGCLVVGSSACGDASFHVDHTPDFVRAEGAPLSIFGVYRDGRLAPEAWDLVRAHLGPLFGTATCDPGYPDIVTPSGTPVLEAIDNFTRDNGVTDELLDRLGGMAKGDLILLVMMTGRPAAHGDTSASPEPSAQGAGFRGGGGRHSAPPASNTSRRPTTETNAFEMVGLVFSKKAHHTVVAVRLSYGGTSMDEAIDSFMVKLGGELPHPACAGWTPDAHLEVGDIRRLATE